MAPSQSHRNIELVSITVGFTVNSHPSRNPSCNVPAVSNHVIQIYFGLGLVPDARSVHDFSSRRNSVWSPSLLNEPFHVSLQ